MNEPTGESPVLGVLEEFFARQREMYTGASLSAVEELLAEDVVWHVPGSSPIAGDHHGRRAVLAYFRRRRELAGGSLKIERHEPLWHDQALVQFADGYATLAGVESSWRTAGVYRVADGQIAEAWLVPLDLNHFDRAWRPTRPVAFTHSQRVRPQDCAASGFLGHPRFLEFFEAAFIECLRSHVGPVDETLGPTRRLTVAEVKVRYLASAAPDDEVRIDVSLDHIGATSIHVHYDASVLGEAAAEATSRYVCVDAATGRPGPLPTDIVEQLHHRSPTKVLSAATNRSGANGDHEDLAINQEGHQW